MKASTSEDVHEVVKDTHTILATGATGVMLLPKAVIADVNAVPPPEVEGLKPTYKLKEVYTIHL
ncbi:MAG: hypothetical protein N3E48_03855 [Candidatus Bathyarchaeota archaeon]|nr:hypothetical protein [Candidatus Bathyarchaeota archaeon]